MRFKTLALATAVATVLTAPVFAELQNVEVGGEIRIRGNAYTDGAGGLTFDEDIDGELQFIEQRSRINVTADFTDDVTVFLEIDNYTDWGLATRQENPFGANAVGQASIADDVDMYQAYIEMREAWGQPLTIRIGRQEIVLGNEWLVGNNDTAAFFTGLSFDAVTARWDFDGGNVFGWASKVVEGEVVFGPDKDQDADFYGLYLTYDGLEAVNLEGYWMYLRDAAFFGIPAGLLGPGAGGATEVHTIGARAYGNVAGFDYDVQAAYQTGETADLGGGAELDLDTFAVDATVGYLFENINNLYVWGGVAYFEGTDADDELSFLRMFSDVEYSEFLADSDMSNVLIIRGGASIQATESIEVSGVASWFEEDEEFGSDDELGIEVALYASYDYSEDLNFNAGWAHFFADDGLEDGAAVSLSGINVIGGGDDDVDYFFLETVISF